MREYRVKRGHIANIKNVVSELFGEFKEESGKIITGFGALERIELECVKNKLRINTVTNADKDTKTTEKTLARWNKFLELATGYTAKERANQMKRS